MKCIILAAGYATRLYPLTENFPKPLLKVGDKAILDWLIDDLSSTGLVDEYFVVTNHKFADIFRSWADGRAEEAVAPEGRNFAGRKMADKITTPPAPPSSRTAVISSEAAAPVISSEGKAAAPVISSEVEKSIHIIDDGTSSNETRLGAVRDLLLAIKSHGIDDDALVMAGDNLLSFSLKEFVCYFKEKGTSCIMRYFEGDEKRLHKSGIVEVDAEDRVISMEEKPAEPKSNWCCPPFYFYTREDLGRVEEAIADGCGVDAPGSLAAWLSERSAVHAWEMPGPRYDIGNLESYEAVKSIFE